MPVPGIWGPQLWELLHKLGYFSDKQPIITEVLRRDTQREIEWLMNNLETIVPCPECRMHIETYRKINPISHGKGLGKWIWDLHESVNKRLGKPAGPAYPDILISKGNLHQLWKEYTKSVFESVQMGNLPGKNITAYARHLFLWKGFSGF
jgi:hypothetical protein